MLAVKKIDAVFTQKKKNKIKKMAGFTYSLSENLFARAF